MSPNAVAARTFKSKDGREMAQVVRSSEGSGCGYIGETGRTRVGQASDITSQCRPLTPTNFGLVRLDMFSTKLIVMAIDCLLLVPFGHASQTQIYLLLVSDDMSVFFTSDQVCLAIGPLAKT